MNIILRRNGVGDPFADNIARHMPGFSVINKDRQQVPVSDVCFRWGTTSNLPGNPKVINSAKAIHRVYDKGGFRRLLASKGLAPKTWDSLSAFVDDPEYPVLVRPNNHVRSQEMNFCEGLSDVVRTVERLRGDGYYISKYIKKTSEYRVFIVCGKIIAMIKKIPVDPNAVSWGCVDQGQFEYINWSEWPLEAARKAVGAFSHSGLHFGAVDVISHHEPNVGERAYVLEINTAPEVTPYYGKCIAKAMNYHLEHTFDQFSLGEGDWRSLIHPAIGG